MSLAMLFGVVLPGIGLIGGHKAALGPPPTFTVTLTSVAAADIAFDASRRVIYASVQGANSIAIVKQKTGVVIGTIATPVAPGLLAVSDDDTKLYFATASGFDRIDLATQTVDQTYTFAGTVGAPAPSPTALTIAPGHPNLVAAGFINQFGTPQPVFGVTLVDNGVTQGTVVIGQGFPSVAGLAFDGTAANLYVENSLGTVLDYTVGSAPLGLTLANQISGVSPVGPLSEKKGKLYAGGQVLTESPLAFVGQFDVAGSRWFVAPKPNVQKAYGVEFGSTPTAVPNFSILSTHTYATLATWPLTGLPTSPIPGDVVTVTKLIFSGAHRAALVTTDLFTNAKTLVLLNIPDSDDAP